MAALLVGHETITEHIDNVTFEQATIEDLNLSDQSLDAVLGLSILNLLKDKEAAIAQVYQMLKPGGIFVSSTACIGNTMSRFKLIVPIGRFLGFFPFVAVFTTQALEDSLTQTGFDLDYQWQPGKDKAVFIVAKKPG